MTHQFKKKFGQNFLRDKNLLKAIVQDAKITSEDDVLEIGSGEGTLTEELANVGKRVVSYEIDNDLMETLEDKELKNVKFIFCDALKENISKIEENFQNKYKIVANLPYYITTPLLFKFLEETDRVKSITVMVQKEVGERMVASCKDDGYGILSVMMQFYGDVKIKRTVKKNMFFPMPDVDSCIVHIDLNESLPLDKLKFSKFVRSAFAMKRKTLANNLSSSIKLPKAEINNLLIQNGFSENVRTEDLTVLELEKVFGIFN